MSYILTHLFETFKKLKKLDEDTRDPRITPLFLCGNPLKMLTVAAAYYIFVKHLGPKLMENRKPFELKNLILVYNTLQVLANSWMVIQIIYLANKYRPYDSYFCMHTFFGTDFYGQTEVRLSHFYFILKVVDYLDTIFFVLRKRYKQISFLHFYHHILMSVGACFVLRYQPGGQMIALGVFNCSVHAIMYSYYFLSSLSPRIKNSLWWKKYLTQLQIIQFIFLFVHFGRAFFDEHCSYPKKILFVGMTQNIVMLVLFIDFYIKAYVNKSKVKEKKSS